MISDCDDKLDPQAIGNALYGLKGMSSDCFEVCNVLSALAVEVSNCEKDLSAQAAGNALYSLQGISSDVPEVRQ